MGTFLLGWGGSGHMPNVTSASGCLCRWLWWWRWWWWESPEGETWLSSLEITSSHRLLRRNIKIHLDITQVFYHGLSDPIPPYHTLHTLKHGYPFLDTLLTFKCKRWKRRGYIWPRMEELWLSFIV